VYLLAHILHLSGHDPPALQSNQAS
jgi:hypothetical protein